MRTRARRAAAARAGSTRLSTAACVSLASILAVLVFVSIPRLRGLAQQENESDARATLELFRAALPVLAAERRTRPPALEDLARAEPIERSLDDGDFLDGGRVLRRHGYLFQLVEVPGGSERGILAWPWEHGATGRSAFLVTPTGRIFRHANTPPCWSGPLAPLAPLAPVSAESGWIPAP